VLAQHTLMDHKSLPVRRGSNNDLDSWSTIAPVLVRTLYHWSHAVQFKTYRMSSSVLVSFPHLPRHIYDSGGSMVSSAQTSGSSMLAISPSSSGIFCLDVGKILRLEPDRDGPRGTSDTSIRV
jgi:hypothetical protein